MEYVTDKAGRQQGRPIFKNSRPLVDGIVLFRIVMEFLHVQVGHRLFTGTIGKMLLFVLFGFFQLLVQIAFTAAQEERLIFIDTKHLRNIILVDLEIDDDPQRAQLRCEKGEE